MGVTHNIERVFYHYQLWEDWHAGLYATRWVGDVAAETACCARLLGSPPAFHDAASRMVSDWKIAAQVNLTNRSQNRQAWIGQATCCHEYGVPEWLTCQGWRLLNDSEQITANKVADQVTEQWENEYAEALLRSGRSVRRKRSNRLDIGQVPSRVRQLQWW